MEIHTKKISSISENISLSVSSHNLLFTGKKIFTPQKPGKARRLKKKTLL